ncbi:MAG: DUF819 family protein, partial [Candidatus Marinimicrobia bacterium]|nr:DUF819 family protein [Candidatus Neomarinimicrobiota bacterium]
MPDNMPLITDPTTIFIYLSGVVALVFRLGEVEKFKKFFHYVPPLIWCYFVPMISTSVGILPDTSPTYAWITRYLLPFSLVLMLLSANLPAIMRLGKTALTMMLAGTVGIVIGAPISLAIFLKWAPEGIWKGLGMLSGSWIGGTANMMAIAEGIGTPASMYGPVIVVDTVVGYGWMGIVIALASIQPKFDKWTGADRSVLDSVRDRLEKTAAARSRPITVIDITSMLGLAFGATYLFLKLGESLPNIGGIISSFTWTVIFVSIFGVGLSFTKISRLEDAGASKLGYAGLYLLLASVGGRADLKLIMDAPVLVMIGIVWLMIHAAVLLTTAKIIKAPMFFFAIGSQANVGGTASAPVVAEVYSRSMAPVGLMMAILGNIIGVYPGLLVAWLC